MDTTSMNYPHFCSSLDLSKIPKLEGKKVQQLLFYFGTLANYAIEIQLKGNTLDCTRNIREHCFYSTGDAITLKEENMAKSYQVEISQREHVEEDPTNECRNYPNQDFVSYGKCDHQFMKNKLDGLTPIWMTENYSEVSTQVTDENDTYSKFFWPLQFWL